MDQALRRWDATVINRSLDFTLAGRGSFEVGFDTTSQRRSDEVGRAGNVPLGVQVIGSRYREDLTLDAAEVIEARHGLPTPIEPAP